MRWKTGIPLLLLVMLVEREAPQFPKRRFHFCPSSLSFSPGQKHTIKAPFTFPLPRPTKSIDQTKQEQIPSQIPNRNREPWGTRNYSKRIDRTIAKANEGESKKPYERSQRNTRDGSNSAEGALSLPSPFLFFYWFPLVGQSEIFYKGETKIRECREKERNTKGERTGPQPARSNPSKFESNRSHVVQPVTFGLRTLMGYAVTGCQRSSFAAVRWRCTFADWIHFNVA